MKKKEKWIYKQLDQWYFFHGKHWRLEQDPSHVLLHSPSQHSHTTPSVLNIFEYPIHTHISIPKFYSINQIQVHIYNSNSKRNLLLRARARENLLCWCWSCIMGLDSTACVYWEVPIIITESKTKILKRLEVTILFYLNKNVTILLQL